GFLDIPGALSDATTGLGLTMLPAHVFAQRLEDLSVSDDSTVVLYSAGQIMWATRVWWMLHSIGCDRALVLDGGYQKWKQEGGPIDDRVPSLPRGRLGVRRRERAFAGKDEVLAAIGS